MKKPVTFIFLLVWLIACAPKTAASESTPIVSPTGLIQGTLIPTKAGNPSPNEKILITSQNNYYLANLDGSDAILLYSGGEEPLTTASLSPDKTKFAYFKNNFLYRPFA